jgi:rhodanese-related sulfurtransferase
MNRSGKLMNLKRLTLQTIIIVILSVLCGLIYNSISTTGISLVYKPLNLESGSYLTIEQTLYLLTEGRALFIDTRYEDEFEQAHIKNAKNLPGNASREEIMKFFESIPKDQQIVTYCSNHGCNSSRRLAGFLTYLGYKKVLIYPEGFNEWETKNFPIENWRIPE